MADETGNDNGTKQGMADDIVTRLRQYVLWLPNTAAGEVCGEAANEIERLRAAGDALVESLDHSRADIRSAVAAWEEARRG